MFSKKYLPFHEEAASKTWIVLINHFKCDSTILRISGLGF